MKQYPGPKLAAASFIPWFLAQYRGDSVKWLSELHQKYGKVVRIAPDELSYVSLEAAQDVWAHRQGHIEFPKYITRIKAPNGHNGILSAKREDHARFRRLLSYSFSDQGIRKYEGTLQFYTDSLVRGLGEHAGKGPQDMVKWLNWTSFDIIGKLAFGKSFGCLEETRTHLWVHAIFANIHSNLVATLLRRLNLLPLMALIAPKRLLEARKFNFQYASTTIDERIEQGFQSDFWDNVLDKSEKQEEKGMSVPEMVTNASNLVLAGSETTATLLSGCVYLLLAHPCAMTKITTEIRSTFSSLEEITLQSVNSGKLKYTLAVLDETMRIYPAVPIQLAREVPPGGDTIEGKFVPGGTVVHVPQFVAYRLASNFTKPLEFHPERFLGVEEFKGDNLAVLNPFGIGPRNCIGRNLAYGEMRTILTKLLWSFDLELDERSRGWIDKQRVFLLWEKPELWVKIKRAEKHHQ